MTKYQIRYYNVVLEVLIFPSRKDAVIYSGFRYDGKIGINVKEND